MKRYVFMHGVGEIPNSRGSWVRYEDIAELITMLKKARSEETSMGMVDKIDALLAKVETK